MEHRQTCIERAFELAKSGKFSRSPDLLGALKREGHATSEIQGPSLRKQLRDLMAAATARKASADVDGS